MGMLLSYKNPRSCSTVAMASLYFRSGALNPTMSSSGMFAAVEAREDPYSTSLCSYALSRSPFPTCSWTYLRLLYG